MVAAGRRAAVVRAVEKGAAARAIGAMAIGRSIARRRVVRIPTATSRHLVGPAGVCARRGPPGGRAVGRGAFVRRWGVRRRVAAPSAVLLLRRVVVRIWWRVPIATVSRQRALVWWRHAAVGASAVRGAGVVLLVMVSVRFRGGCDWRWRRR